MSQNYKIVETMRSDADEMEGWGAGNEAGRTRQAASLIQELGEALEGLRLQALQSSVNEPANEWGQEALEKTNAILSKLKEA
jgi:hypothetical protein